jgi:hypothetical protein
MKKSILSLALVIGIVLSTIILALAFFRNTTGVLDGSFLPVLNLTAEVVSAEEVAHLSIDEQRAYSVEYIFSTNKSYYVRIHSRVDRRVVVAALLLLGFSCIGVWMLREKNQYATSTFC